MDLQSLIAKMDAIERKGLVTEGVSLDDIMAAVGQDKDEQSRAAKLNDIAWKEKLPGLYDPVSGNFVRKQSMPTGMAQRYNIAATGSESSDRALADLGLIPDNAKTSTALGRAFRGDDKGQYDQDIKSRSQAARGEKPSGQGGQDLPFKGSKDSMDKLKQAMQAANAGGVPPNISAAGSEFGTDATFAGRDPNNPFAPPAPAPAPAAADKDIDRMKELLAKAQAGKTVAKESFSMFSLNMAMLVESLGYVYEGLEDLSDEERKELMALMDKNKDKPEAKDAIDQYTKLRATAPAGSPEKQDVGTTRYAPGYDPSTGRMQGEPAPAPAPAPSPENKPNEPGKRDPKKNPYYDPNIAKIQELYNKNGITDNAGKRLSVDGVWGWRSEEAKWNFRAKFPAGSPQDKEDQAYAEKIRKDLQWRLIPDRATGQTARMGPDRSKPKDPAIGNPTPAAAKAMGISVTPETPAPPTKPNSDIAPQPEKTPPGWNTMSRAGTPPELAKIDPRVHKQYWVNGIRYNFTGIGTNGTWDVSFRPTDMTGTTANRQLAADKYTGPVPEKKVKRDEPAYDPSFMPESLDRIKHLSGL